jgi:hypothetical protein
LHHRDQLTFEIASGNRVVRLQRFKSCEPVALGDPEGFYDLPCRPVGHSDVTNMTVLHERIQCSQSFFHGCCRVEPVNLVQVDVVELQALQALLGGIEQMHPRSTPAVGP